MKTLKTISLYRLSIGLRRQTVIPALLLSAALVPELVLAQAPLIPDEVKANVMMWVTNGFTPSIVVGVVNSNGSTFFSCGVRDLDTGVPADETSIYEIGSITKTFTCTVLSQMVMDGTLALTNPVKTYLPENVLVPSRNGKVITLQHLATHYSGLPCEPVDFAPADPRNPFADYTIQQMYDFLSRYQLPRDPGAAYEYSNFGMGLLGYVLQLKTGSDYQSLIAERITGPLGMTNSGVGLSSGAAGNSAGGYSGVVPTPNWDFTPTFAGAGSLRASPRDLLHYIAANMGLVQTDLYPAMANAHKPLNIADSLTSTSIGLAWWTTPLQGDQATWHSGRTFGYCTFAGFLQSKKLGVVVLANCGEVLQAVMCLGEHLLDPTVPLQSVPATTRVDLQTLRNCVGRYQRSAGTYFDIGLQHGYLTVAYSGDNGFAYTLYPSSPGSFFVTIVDATAVFRTNSLGLATSLSWSQNGHSNTYDRVALPSRLAIHRVNGGNQITFSGDTGVDYILEATTDLAHWQPISTNTIWAQPAVVPESGASRFYRLRRP